MLGSVWTRASTSETRRFKDPELQQMNSLEYSCVHGHLISLPDFINSSLVNLAWVISDELQYLVQYS